MPEKRSQSLRPTRRDFLRQGTGAVLSSTALGHAAQQRVKATPPNIVLIVTDQHHIDAVSAYGSPHVKTPALDYLAGRSTSFAQSYCADPVCSPSRSSIFSGRMPSETGVFDNGLPIRQGIPNLGQWFTENSEYETVYAGKWHLPRTYQSRIEGFRVLPGGIGGQGNQGDPCVSRACETYLRNRSSQRPFLLVASFLQPHDICEWLRLNMKDQPELRYPELASELPPLPENFDIPSPEPKEIQRRRQGNEPAMGRWSKLHWRYYLWSYYRHVEMVDGEIGRILEALEATGHTRDTVVIFTADHGEGMAHHQMVRKHSPYDESSKVPFLISWPGYFPENRQDPTTLVSGADILPTLCDIAGIPAPPNMRGRSLRPLLEGKRKDQREFLVVEIPPDVGRMVRTPPFKYVTFAGDAVEQLFDLQNDPGETRNLAGDPRYAGTLEDCRKLLLEWEARLDVTPKLPNANAWWRTGKRGPATIT